MVCLQGRPHVQAWGGAFAPPVPKKLCNIAEIWINFAILPPSPLEVEKSAKNNVKITFASHPSWIPFWPPPPHVKILRTPKSAHLQVSHIFLSVPGRCKPKSLKILGIVFCLKTCGFYVYFVRETNKTITSDAEIALLPIILSSMEAEWILNQT